MCEARLLSPHADRAATVLQTLSNKQRLLLVCQLIDGEKSVSELTEAAGLRQATVSQHLAKLRERGLVQTRRDAQMIYYRLAGAELRSIIENLVELYGNPANQTDVPTTRTAEAI
ncbi:MAG: metalloregulator ArsR/SmtB family transcription factor [Pseudomonadota bacterium]